MMRPLQSPGMPLLVSSVIGSSTADFHRSGTSSGPVSSTEILISLTSSWILPTALFDFLPDFDTSSNLTS